VAESPAATESDASLAECRFLRERRHRRGGRCGELSRQRSSFSRLPGVPACRWCRLPQPPLRGWTNPRQPALQAGSHLETGVNGGYGGGTRQRARLPMDGPRRLSRRCIAGTEVVVLHLRLIRDGFRSHETRLEARNGSRYLPKVSGIAGVAAGPGSAQLAVAVLLLGVDSLCHVGKFCLSIWGRAHGRKPSPLRKSRLADWRFGEFGDGSERPEGVGTYTVSEGPASRGLPGPGRPPCSQAP
jgi:hypothetical protein